MISFLEMKFYFTAFTQKGSLNQIQIHIIFCFFLNKSINFLKNRAVYNPKICTILAMQEIAESAPPQLKAGELVKARVNSQQIVSILDRVNKNVKDAAYITVSISPIGHLRLVVEDGTKGASFSCVFPEGFLDDFHSISKDSNIDKTFHLRDLSDICLLFKSQSKIIPSTLIITEEGLEISTEKLGFGKLHFHAMAVTVQGLNGLLPMEVEGEGDHQMNEKDALILKIKSINPIEQVLNTMRKFKVEMAYICYNSKDKTLDIKTDNPTQCAQFNLNWQIKIQCPQPKYMKEHRYSYKKLRLALGVFPKDASIWLAFYESGVLHMFSVSEKDNLNEKNKAKRDIRIKISAQGQI